MKQLAIILIILLSSCKPEPKKETLETELKTAIGDDTDQTVSEMWNDFTEANPEFKNDPSPDADYFHNNEEDANRLAKLIRNGKKMAGSNLYFFYEQANADLPEIGTKSIVTDFDGTARAIIQITKVDTIPFNQISREYAEMDMGTNSEALKKWKKAHWDFFAPAMKENGVEPSEDMLIVCEWFETIWPERK